MERLTKIQVGLRVTKDKSGDKGRFKFRSAEDIFEKLKPLLEETKTAVVVSDELVEIGGKLAIKATASLLCQSNSGVLASASGYALFDKHEIVKKDTGELISTMSNEQCTGSASSYARKYALCGLFAIDNEENDPDQPDIKRAGSSAQKEPSKPTPQPKPEMPTEAKKTAPTSKEQEDLYLQIVSDIESCDSISCVMANVAIAEGRQFENKVRKVAAEKGIKLAKNVAEINQSYNLIKDREGWEDVKTLALKTVADKKLK